MSPGRHPRRLRVAIAEDDETLCALLAEALELEGFEVLCFNDGLELCDYFSVVGDGDPWPDAIVTDVSMPGRSGLEAIEVARGRGAMSPAFVVSGSADPAVRAYAARLGNTLFFAKPIEVERLAVAIAQLAYLNQRRPLSPKPG
jgi:CheY-like chemotaxis protein